MLAVLFVCTRWPCIHLGIKFLQRHYVPEANYNEDTKNSQQLKKSSII